MAHTIELMTHRGTGRTFVVLGQAATAYDGSYLGYDIYQAAGPLGEREARAIRRNALDWRHDPEINIDRLMQTIHEYSMEMIAHA